MQVAREFGLRENLSTVFRHRRKILTVFIATVLVAVVGSYALSKVYQAQARVLVQINREPLRLTPAIGPAAVASSVISPRDEIITEIEIFKSPLIAERLVERLGPDQVLSNMRWRWDFLREFPSKARKWALEQIWSVPDIREVLEGFGLSYSPGVVDPAIVAAAKISDNLDIFPIPKASVFEVNFEAPSPEFAALAVNTLMEIYLEHHLEIRRPNEATAFYTAEADRLREELREAEEQLQAFKRDSGIFSVNDQIALLLERLDRLESERAEAHLQAFETDELIAGIREQLEGQDGNVQVSQVRSLSPVAEELRLKILTLELERARYATGSPTDLRLEQEIAETRTRFRNASGRVVSTETSSVSQAYQDLQSRLINLEGNRRAHHATLELIDAEMGVLRDELRRLDRQSVVLRSMNREVDLMEEALTLYLRKTEETRVDSLLDERKVSNVRPIEFASMPIVPVRPRKLINIALGIVAGLIGGVSLAYLSEFFRRTLTTREEAEGALEQPVLASVQLERKRRKRGRNDNLIEFRRLAESVAQMCRQRSVAKVLVSSTSRYEGKSFVSLNLAAAIANQGKRVLLVDADFYGHGNNKARRKPASANACPSQAEQVPTMPTPAETDRPNVDRVVLSVLRSETKGVHDFYRRAADIIDLLAVRYDMVLVESSALDSQPEQLLLASEIGAVMFVVEAERTPAVTAKHSMAELQEAGASIVGVVLNKRRLIIPGWIYNWFLSPKRAAIHVA